MKGFYCCIIQNSYSFRESKLFDIFCFFWNMWHSDLHTLLLIFIGQKYSKHVHFFVFIYISSQVFTNFGTPKTFCSKKQIKSVSHRFHMPLIVEIYIPAWFTDLVHLDTGWITSWYTFSNFKDSLVRTSWNSSRTYWL